MRELEKFRSIFPKQEVLPGFQSHLGLPPEKTRVSPSLKKLLEIIYQQAQRTEKLPVSGDLVVALADYLRVDYDGPLGEFRDKVADGVFEEEIQEQEKQERSSPLFQRKSV